ncbi:uncharacterized protein LOC110700724 [Chenopodium quinoa]|nr:uncharacterized protein LOC110700724 [Chenopodium quinoa]XP_021734011.1 uncharacterized protein LOC110700724 [Chenopodium quinoa]XP_021734012.1 uncharacterized protein LOC110700724 [Chenopodium quinoa]XP_021734013.1 uncharacterized protein LOC110700724 [Chenopodium quinoa]
MDRWTGILKVPVCPKGTAICRIAASLCVSPSKSLLVPTANVIFFNGDRVGGTNNPVIERLSDIQNIADILVSKLGASINAWVIEAPTFNGPFAIYKEFIQSLNQRGEPQYYRPDGFPASISVIALLSNFLEERAKHISCKEQEPQLYAEHASSCLPRTFVFGFSKGGVVLNQLITELGFSDIKDMEDPQKLTSFNKFAGKQIVPVSRESLFDSITEIHYVDVGLNSSGAYLTDDNVIQRVAERLTKRDKTMRFVLHGTPRQWSDVRRPWIREEKDKFCQILKSEGLKSKGKLEVYEINYFTESFPNLQMHFEIIEKLVVSW